LKISTILLGCALCLSTTAAYYSIAGLAAIFASSFWPVVAMATILEISKLVVASWLYQKWNIIPPLLKIYLTTAVVVLMIITSLGIFGFLTRAHVEAGLANTELSLKLEQITGQIDQHKTAITRYQTQLSQLDKSINIQLDANRATQALASRKSQESERNDIKTKLEIESKTIQDLTDQQLKIKQDISIVETKIGPIKYIAEFFANGSNVDTDQAVRYVIIVLVLVFDPLAVLMLIAANISIKNETSRVDTVESKPRQETVKDTQNEPVLGQTMVIGHSGQTVWWTGQAWELIPSQMDTSHIATNDVVDANVIKEIVTDSLDKWLAKTLSEPTSQNEPKPTTISTDISIDKPTADTHTVVDNTAEVNNTQEPVNDAVTQTASTTDTYHVLDHFKPTHINYSSRK